MPLRLRDNQLMDLEKVSRITEVKGERARYLYRIGKREYIVPMSLHRKMKIVVRELGKVKVRVIILNEGEIGAHYDVKPLGVSLSS